MSTLNNKKRHASNIQYPVTGRALIARVLTRTTETTSNDCIGVIGISFFNRTRWRAQSKRNRDLIQAQTHNHHNPSHLDRSQGNQTTPHQSSDTLTGDLHYRRTKRLMIEHTPPSEFHRRKRTPDSSTGKREPPEAKPATHRRRDHRVPESIISSREENHRDSQSLKSQREKREKVYHSPWVLISVFFDGVLSVV
ncbi:hypothetical protein F2Q69_00063104 [Brassica cretica]|uniref:Uncharacterized protein n=1 Tax=Brassica cretica TaxID=69181 RepID=A0A8S9RK49_BRACR|nr:hypothetical protein F2Q69_00063104 [Brassica cretica]